MTVWSFDNTAQFLPGRAKHVLHNTKKESTSFSWGGKINHHLIAYYLSSTLPASAQCVSIGFTSSDVSDVPSMPSQRLHWFMHSWCHVWDTVTLFWLAHPSLPQTSSSKYWTLQLASSLTLGSMTTDSPICCMISRTVGAVQAVCHGLPMSATKASCYMIDCCTPTSDVACRQHLQSAGCHN